MFQKRRLTLEEMLDSEKWIEKNWNTAMEGCKNYSDLAKKLGLFVEYIPANELGNGIEAVLAPSNSKHYNGVIRINNEYRNINFSFVHELIHYLSDVGIGNPVTCQFTRKKKGSDKTHHEQIIDFRAAAATMKYQEIKKDIIRYDKSKPKLDELRFIDELCKKYSQEPASVLRRIREVRREYYKKIGKIASSR